MNQRQFPLQARFGSRHRGWKQGALMDKQHVESQTALLHQTAVWETWFKPELHLPALFLHMKKQPQCWSNRERWRPPRVLFLGSLAVDRTAGRWVRNRAVATSDGWTDNKIRYGQGGRKGGGGEGRRATTGSWVGWHQFWEDMEACERVAKENWAVTCLNQTAWWWKAGRTRNERSYSNSYSQHSTACLLAWRQLPL